MADTTTAAAIAGAAPRPALWQGQTEHVPLPARLVRVRQLTPHEKYFAVRPETDAPLAYYPGQFVQLWVPLAGEAPISIASAPAGPGSDAPPSAACEAGPDCFEIAVRSVGNVTRALHAMREGDIVGVRGPYGHGFPVEEFRGGDLLLVVGGIGFAPLRSLLRHVLLHRGDFGSVRLLYGARTPEDFLFRDEMDALAREGDVDVQLTIDRPAAGWAGHVGVVTTLMADLPLQVWRTWAVVCGPPVMYKYVIIALDKYRLAADRIFLSLERRMECGLGKCGHCQINSQYVCKSGPVFTYAAVRHLPEAFATL